MPLLEELSGECASLAAKGLKRSLQPLNSSFINLASNNYLGLAQRPSVIAAARKACQEWGTGSASSRLVAGNLRIHEELESSLARFKSEERSLTFTSGYAANLGALAALANEDDVILIDRYCHASLVDGARLSRAKIWVYPHLDMTRLSELLGRAQSFRRRWIVTDAYFSMDGDLVPLPKLIQICRDNQAKLYLDEAHSVGVYGAQGGGLTQHFKLTGRVDVVMGTLSKALGSVGGYIAGSAALREFLIQKARSFIYTTGPAPSASAAALESLRVIKTTPSLRKKLWANVDFLRQTLVSQDYDLMGSEGPIIPVRIGQTRLALQCQEFLRKKGIHAVCIRPPTVPKNTDRIRVSVTATHKHSELDYVAKSFKQMRALLHA